MERSLDAHPLAGFSFLGGHDGGAALGDTWREFADSQRWAERYANATAGLDMPDLATAVRLVYDLIAAAEAASEDG